MDIGLVILISLAIGAFSIQVAYASSLSEKVKNRFAMMLPYQFSPLLKFNSWRKIFGSATIFLAPFILLLVIGFNIHHFVSKMFGCPYCISYQLMWIVCYFGLGMVLWQSLVLGGLALFSVTIIEKLMS